MKYLSSLPILLLTASLPFAASADSLSNGQYTVAFEGGEGSLVITDGHAQVSVASLNCSGTTGGAVSDFVDRVATFTDRQHGDACTIAITVDESGAPVLIEEASAGCQQYHGASCSFHGEVLGPEVPHSIAAIDAGFNSLSRRARTEAQEVLRDRGYYAGAIDGATGPGTRRAIIGAARADLGTTPALDLSNEDGVRVWLLELADTQAGEPLRPPAPAEQNAPVSDDAVAPESLSEPVTTGGAQAWLGEWRCEADQFDGPARFTFDGNRATFHNLGATMTHGGAQPIGGRENALTIEFSDGEVLGLFDIQPAAMIIVASLGVFDCTR